MFDDVIEDVSKLVMKINRKPEIDHLFYFFVTMNSRFTSYFLIETSLHHILLKQMVYDEEKINERDLDEIKMAVQ